MDAYTRVKLSRDASRPHLHDYIEHLFDDFYELHGDRLMKDDQSIIGGIAYYRDMPVTIIGHVKGRNLAENMKSNFGMGSPEGYRKALRLMKQAEKFHRPIITFIDTPGAYPGIESEEFGIGEAIGQCIYELSTLKTPVIIFIVGEGGSGGALALAVGDYIVMMENSIYSILSPEGFASILWKDVEGKRVAEASKVMKLTSHDLYEAGFIDEIIEEKENANYLNAKVYHAFRKILDKKLYELTTINPNQLVENRLKKIRNNMKVNH